MALYPGITPLMAEIQAIPLFDSGRGAVVVPNNWFHNLTLPYEARTARNGEPTPRVLQKPDTIACFVLGEIVYRYRIVTDTTQRSHVAVQCRLFEGAEWWTTLANLARRWNDAYSVKQIREALHRLQDVHGAITLKQGNYENPRTGKVRYNVLFPLPIPARIREITDLPPGMTLEDYVREQQDEDEDDFDDE